MSQAVRAIIIENESILVIRRDKYGDPEYFTLVGGQVSDGETLEQALTREVLEETGLTVTEARLVFFEKHPAPYNEQYIYLCRVAPHEAVSLQQGSEEATMNRIGMNNHYPEWARLASFSTMPFRTPQLQVAITKALSEGFPEEPLQL